MWRIQTGFYFKSLFQIAKNSIAPITATTNSPIQLYACKPKRLKTQPPKAPPMMPKTRFTIHPLPFPSNNLLATKPARIPVINPTIMIPI